MVPEVESANSVSCPSRTEDIPEVEEIGDPIIHRVTEKNVQSETDGLIELQVHEASQGCQRIHSWIPVLDTKMGFTILTVSHSVIQFVNICYNYLTNEQGSFGHYLCFVTRWWLIIGVVHSVLLVWVAYFHYQLPPSFEDVTSPNRVNKNCQISALGEVKRIEEGGLTGSTTHTKYLELAKCVQRKSDYPLVYRVHFATRDLYLTGSIGVHIIYWGNRFMSSDNLPVSSVFSGHLIPLLLAVLELWLTSYSPIMKRMGLVIRLTIIMGLWICIHTLMGIGTHSDPTQSRRNLYPVMNFDANPTKALLSLAAFILLPGPLGFLFVKLNTFMRDRVSRYLSEKGPKSTQY